MSTDRERLQQLEESYRRLWDQHTALKEEIKENYAEFKILREKYGVPAQEQPGEKAIQESVTTSPESIPEVKETVLQRPVPVIEPIRQPVNKPAEKSNWEQYIGEQLLSKIGIAILIIGVAIGAKYAIDHEILTPGMRITGGYLIAAVLGFFAFRFKEKYTAFSAVLVSGSMAVCYFITYAAFRFYGIFPYGLTFGLLLLTTAGTVYSALRYNQVVIAHIGLIGAYVLPALIAVKPAHLSNYLAYMAVINGGILFISFLRNWKSVYYVAFGWTSLVFIVWFFSTYDEKADMVYALSYASAYFVLFHTTAIAYPLVKRQAFKGADIVLILPNVLVFLGIGNYVLFAAPAVSEHAAPLFVFIVSAVLFALWAVFRQIRKEDELLHQTHLVTALSVLTLSFMLELEGAGLVFAMALEATVLTWFALKSNWKSLDIFSVIIISIAACCFLFAINDHLVVRASNPFANEPFLVLLATVAVALGGYVFFRRSFPETVKNYSAVTGLLLFFLVGFFLVLFSEIYMSYLNKAIDPAHKHKLMAMSEIALVALYWLVLVTLNKLYFRFKNEFNWLETCSVIIVIALLLSITGVSQVATNSFSTGNQSVMYSVLRYVAIGSLLSMLISWIRTNAANATLVTVFHICLLWVLSLEMTHWLTVSGNRNAYKLSLSILWGAYAIYIMFAGMKKNISALRVTAMIILGVTLVKLFFYDIVHLSMLSKTIVFMALGGLLLVGAYFYQRYKREEELPEEKE